MPPGGSGGAGWHPIRVQQTERDAIQVEPVARNAGMPRHAIGGYFVEEAIVGGVRERSAGLDDKAGAKPIEDGGRAPDVVAWAWGDDQRRDCRCRLPREKRDDDSLARVPALRPGARIDHHEAAAGRAEDGTVPLPHIEKM